MLDALQAQPADALLALIKLHAADPRDDKIDLGVGVYRTGDGATPVFKAIKGAEQRLVDEQDSKSYLGPEGDGGFVSGLMPYIFGGNPERGGRIAGMQTPGGTGAVRLALALAQKAGARRVHLGTPSWPNHAQIVSDLGLETVPFDHALPDGTANLDAVLRVIREGGEGELVLLHGCCHNPTGANLTQAQWGQVVAHLQKTGAVPLIDIAYQGFGDGLSQDAAATRLIAAGLPEVLIAASCSKNFGIYRERAGLLMTIVENSTSQPVTQSTLNFLNRQNYSFPPDHGARLVTMILNDAALRDDWQSELEDTRLAMLELREQLAAELRQRTNSDRFDFIARHRGMFSRIGATPAQVEAMRLDYGIYMVGDSRLNIAGLNAKTVPILAEAIVASGV